MYETIFRAAYGSLYIYSLSHRKMTLWSHYHIGTHLCLNLFGAASCHGLPFLHLQAIVELLHSLLVILQQLQCPVTHRELLRQILGLVHLGRYRCNLLLYDISVVDVDVSCGSVLPLEKLNHRVEQLVQSFVVACDSRNHWNTKHAAKVLVIDLCAAGKQLVIHVQRNYRAQVHVNEFCCKVQVPLKVRCHHRIYDNVGHLLKKVAAHINLLGRICRNGVCSRQVGQVDAVTLVVETACLGINGNTAVVAHMLVAVR